MTMAEHDEETRTETAPDPLPWERQPGESAKAYAHFGTYLMMGAERSIAKLAEERGRGARVLKEWSVKYRWVDRVAAWEDDQQRRARQVAEAETIQMNRHLTNVGEWLRGRGVNWLFEHPDALTSASAIRLVEAGVRIEREARAALADDQADEKYMMRAGESDRTNDQRRGSP
jgi:hypothetical protein